MAYDNDDQNDEREGFDPYESTDDELEEEYLEDELEPGEDLYDDVVDEEDVAEEDVLYSEDLEEESYDPFGGDDEVDNIIEERDRREN